MKKSILFLSLSFFFVLSCKENDTININCTEGKPIENNGWLQQKIESWEQSPATNLQYFYVSQAEYKGSTIFIFGNCCPVCNTVIAAYNCEGEYVGKLGNNDDDIPFSILNNQVLIWTPDDFACFTNDN